MHVADPPVEPTNGGNPRRVDLGMVCTCDAQDLQAAEGRTRRVRDTLPESGGPLVTAICGSLLMNQGVGSIEIHADQWFAVTAVTRDGTRYVISCDEVEHGLAKIWDRVHADRSGD